MSLACAAALALGATVVTASLPAGAADTLPGGGGHAQAGVVPGARAPRALSPSATTPPGFSIRGIDVSSNDHAVYPIDWTAVAASGVSFAYVKATEGRTYTNPYFDADYHAAKAAGLLTGAYVYARPDSGDPVGQANYFVDQAQWSNDPLTLVPFLDMEWPYGSLLTQLGNCWGLTPTAMSSWIRAFVEQVRARIGRPMMIYTNTNWWNPCTGNDTSFGNQLLDIAGYTSSPPPLPSGWSTFALWQYAPGNNSVAGDYDKEVFNGDYAALTKLAGGSPATAPPIGLLAAANNRYVTAENAGSMPLIANRDAIGSWEKFDLIDAGGGYTALRSRINGKYVTAENAGSMPLIANRDAIGSWEKFQVVNNPDGSFSLRAAANGLYVTAENAGSMPLIANRSSIGLWEEFFQYAVPKVVSLSAAGVGQYVTAENAGSMPLIANRGAIGGWEQFDQVDAGNGWIGLRAHANGKYVTAENFGAQPLIANRTAVGLWERFKLVDNPDGSVSLHSAVNGKYVSAADSASPLIASATAIGPTEKFYLVD